MTKTFLKFVNYYKNTLLAKTSKYLTASFSEKYLLYTNVVISFSMSGCGDVLVQHYEMISGELEQFDKIRTRNMCVYGLTIGFFCHHWYNYLDRFLPGNTLQTVVKKILLDQFICSPVCVSTLFLTCGLLEGQNLEQIKREFKQKGWILYTAEWIVWPPAQFINFYLLPTRFRVVYDNCISLGCDIYTSYIKHTKPEDESNAEENNLKLKK